jgi:hypothetical protein
MTMIKSFIVIIVCFLLLGTCFAQTETHQSNKLKIKTTITGFLKWYKLYESSAPKTNFRFIKGGYPDTTTKQRIDKDGVEQYLDDFRKSGFVSEAYIDNLRHYFMDIDEDLKLQPIMKDLVKINGMDTDFALQTFEPDEILDHIDESKIQKLTVIYNKAIVSLKISKHVILLFILSKQRNNQWLIDYMGHDATDLNSFFRQ